MGEQKGRVHMLTDCPIWNIVVAIRAVIRTIISMDTGALLVLGLPTGAAALAVTGGV